MSAEPGADTPGTPVISDAERTSVAASGARGEHNGAMAELPESAQETTTAALLAGYLHAVLIPNGLSAMGFGVPAAIAARLTRPDRPVIALVGDGGFAMTATEMRIASALGLPVTVAVFADNSLNRIELRQQLMGYPPTATRMDGMDLVALAEAMDCDGARADSPAALEKALSGFAARSRPLIVEARVDPAQYEAQF